MKNLGFLCLVLGLSFINVAHAAKPSQEKLKGCEQTLGAGIFNGLLENICGFEGGVKDKLLQMYDEGQCRKIVPQKTVDKTAKDVAADTKMRISAFGEHTFCEVNMKPYVDLKEAFN